MLNGISAARVTEINGKIAELQKCEQAVEVAAKATFGGLEMKDVGGDVWRELLMAAEVFDAGSIQANPSQPVKKAPNACSACNRLMRQRGSGWKGFGSSFRTMYQASAMRGPKC